MATKRKQKKAESGEATVKTERTRSAGRGRQQRELSREELEQLRARLQKKFH